MIYEPQLFSSTVFISKSIISGISSTIHKKHNNLIVMFAFQDLLQISPDIFQELFLDNFVSKKLVLAKRKSVLKKKKTLGFSVAEKKKPLFLGVCISIRGRITCNTRKT